MKLPNADKALIPESKLREYCLNPKHDDGQHKAYLFSKLLDIHSQNLDLLRNALKESIKNYEVDHTSRTSYGTIYYVDFPMIRQERTFQIRSIWIIRDGETIPRFVSCYIKRRKSR
jgi:hypothetical protein